MEYDYDSNKVTTRTGKIIQLSNTENDILNYLYENKGKVCTNEEMANFLYGDYERAKSIPVWINRLRKRIGKSIEIRTVSKKGYIID